VNALQAAYDQRHANEDHHQDKGDYETLKTTDHSHGESPQD
jgi:hypothetical protein